MPRPTPMSPVATLCAALLIACSPAYMAAEEPEVVPDPQGIRLRVEAGPAVGSDADHRALYVTGRRAGTTGEPQLAKRFDADLPADLLLTAHDLLVPGTLSDDWQLTARLDRDGFDPIQAGDVAGRVELSVTAGRGAATIVLDTRLTEADASVDEGPRFRGTLELDPRYAALDGTRTVFLSIKQSPEARGMPRASLRIDRARFPLQFDIGVEHVPLQVDNKEDMLTGELWFIARMDADGNALSRTEGDLSSEPRAVTAGDAPFTVTLDIPYTP